LNAISRFTGILALGLWTTVASAQDGVLRVLGQPVAAGPIQQIKEQPFFERLTATAGQTLRFEYIPLGSPGFADTGPLAALRSGAVQIAALRISQAGRAEPSMLGLDLVGLNTDYKTARQMSDAYTPTLDQRLQERIGVKLIGPWPFGPEVLFCNRAMTKLSDIKGRKVRVADPDTAKLVELAEGTAVQLSFSATLQALSTGAVDCAIGSPTAAVAAGWPRVTTHVLPIAFQMGINGYGVALSTWNRLPPAQQAALAAALQRLSDDIWTYSEDLTERAIACSIGSGPCESGGTFGLTKVPVTGPDQALARRALREASFPRWAQTCDAQEPGCSARWKQAVGGLVGIR
jgi:TRAP-type C4-dicarboxylate transport system substrate-binding protein